MTQYLIRVNSFSNNLIFKRLGCRFYGSQYLHLVLYERHNIPLLVCYYIYIIILNNTKPVFLLLLFVCN